MASTAEELQQLDRDLLMVRLERRIVDVVQSSEQDWLEYKKVVDHLSAVLPNGIEIIQADPEKYFDRCDGVMFRKVKEYLHISTQSLDSDYYVALHDREHELMKRRAGVDRVERKRKREEWLKANEDEPPNKKKKATKVVKLRVAIPIYSNREFASEMGVLNGGVKVQLDLMSLQSDRIRMIHPLECWIGTDEADLTNEELDEFTGLGEEDTSELEAALEPTGEEEDLLLTQHVKVFSRRLGVPRFEMGTLWKNLWVKYDKGHSADGWVRISAPIAGWVTFEELRPRFPAPEPEPEVKEIKEEELKGSGKPSEPIDLTGDSNPPEVEKAADAKDEKMADAGEKASEKTEEAAEKDEKMTDAAEKASAKTEGASEKTEEATATEAEQATNGADKKAAATETNGKGPMEEDQPVTPTPPDKDPAEDPAEMAEKTPAKEASEEAGGGETKPVDGGPTKPPPMVTTPSEEVQLAPVPVDEEQAKKEAAKKEKAEADKKAKKKEDPAEKEEEADKKDKPEVIDISLSGDESKESGALKWYTGSDDEEDDGESDEDYEEIADLDDDNLSGKWSCGKKGGCFTLNHNMKNGKLDGQLDDKNTCSIEGKVEGAKVEFNQNWQAASVHGEGVVTVVKGTHHDRHRTMKVSFECTNSEGKKIHGTNVLYKDPIGDISGVWYPEGGSDTPLYLAIEGKGSIDGFVVDPNVCKIDGRLSGHMIKFKQVWQCRIRDLPVDVEAPDKLITTTVEGFVNTKCTKMTVRYSMPSPDGKTLTGNLTYRKKTNRALEGLWVSGDQGGRFVFKEEKGNKFTGYLDTNGLCRIEGTVSKGLDIKFTQHWLSTSAHKGGVHQGAIAYVKGIANEDLTTLSLEYRCEKKDGQEIKGKSQLKRTAQTTKPGQKPEKALSNACFNGKHLAFPPNVFVQYNGLNQKLGSIRVTSSSNGYNLSPLWTRTQKILILGEADFSFTLALAREFRKGYATLIGSSYLLKDPNAPQPPNSPRWRPRWGHGRPPPRQHFKNHRKRQFLNETQRKLDPILDEVVDRGAFCRFGVDARNLHQTLWKGPYIRTKWSGQHTVKPCKWDRIIFPFPRASLTRWNPVLDTELIRGTFRSAAKELHPKGELHIILHTSRQGIAQFDLWSIRDIAESENMIWRAALPFDPKKLPAYQPKDVTGTPWRPFEPRIHVFTPMYSEWQPANRLWR